VLGGWEVSPIITWQSGTPFSLNPGNSNVAYGELNKGDGCFDGCSADRADRVPGVPLKVRQGGRANWTKQYFNTAAFTTRHDGTFGTSERNMLQGPPSFNIDSSLMKNWTILALQRHQPPHHEQSGRQPAFGLGRSGRRRRVRWRNQLRQQRLRRHFQHDPRRPSCSETDLLTNRQARAALPAARACFLF